MKTTLIASLLIAALSANAHPSARKHSRRRVIDLNRFRVPLKSSYDNATVAGESSSSIQAFLEVTKADQLDAATRLVQETVPGATFRLVEDHWVGSNGIAHVYFRQTVNGLDIDNADFNVNVAADGTIFSFGNSFFRGEVPTSLSLGRRDINDPIVALRGASDLLQLPVSTEAAVVEAGTDFEVYSIKRTSGAERDPEARLVYFQTAGGSLKLTWRIETDISSNWLLTYVDAVTKQEIHGVVDYVADFIPDFSYNVYPFGTNDPSQGSRLLVKNPWTLESSEFGWQSDGNSTYSVTRGNNGIAQSNPSGSTTSYLNNSRPISMYGKFDYPYTPDVGDPAQYVNAAVTQVWYTSNAYHDLLYTLGFTEAAGNFETNVNGQGGRGNDAVILNVQDGAGLNNANFATPADGTPGRMRMYLWNKSSPGRDGAFDAGVVIHEYTHGLSNRLTGGPANSGCLGALESGGMGEGWSDFYATTIRLKANDTRDSVYPIGAWVANNPVGIRQYQYSTDLNTNRHMYTALNNLTAVHAIGNVWATFLYEVAWNLIDKHGIASSLKPVLVNGVPTDGRHLAMKLVLDGMTLQPCNPNFVQARDAILDADKALTGGENQCELWSAFAKRGLGAAVVSGMGNRTNSLVVPDGVC